MGGLCVNPCTLDTLSMDTSNKDEVLTSLSVDFSLKDRVFIEKLVFASCSLDAPLLVDVSHRDQILL
ncbi:hypothetical protein SK128_009223, partial [Halocaridina rubra]